MTRDDDNGHLGPVAMNELHRLQTVHRRHEDIDNEQIEGTGSEQVETLAAVVGYDDFMGVTREQYFDCRKNCVIIIDDENACHGSP
jgi:hypothetical protein